MQHTILIAHVVIGMLFVLSVLIQDKGTGLSAALGGSGGFYASQRGAAKVIHYLTVLLCAAFFATALAYVVVPASVPDAAPVSVTPDVTSQPVKVELPAPTPATSSQPVKVEAVPANSNK